MDTKEKPSQETKVTNQAPIERNPKEIIAEYERRHTFWSEQALSQLGYSTNLFFTLSLGFLAYIIAERKNYPAFHFDLRAGIDWKLVLYFIVLILVFISLIIGASVIISRLYDLRITRFLVWARKRAYAKHQKLLPDRYINLHGKPLTPNFISTVVKIDFLNGEDFDDFDSLATRFEQLRVQQKLLGMFTWKYHWCHIRLILLGALVWSISTILGW